MPASLAGHKVVAIAACGYYSLALTDDGTVIGWGCRRRRGVHRAATQFRGVMTAIAASDGPHSLAIVAPVPTVTAVTPAAGRTTGGKTVTITGTGLTGTTSLNFGRHPRQRPTRSTPTSRSLPPPRPRRR